MGETATFALRIPEKTEPPEVRLRLAPRRWVGETDRQRSPTEVAVSPRKTPQRRVWDHETLAREELGNLGQSQVLFEEPGPDLVAALEESLIALTGEAFAWWTSRATDRRDLLGRRRGSASREAEFLRGAQISTDRLAVGPRRARDGAYRLAGHVTPEDLPYVDHGQLPVSHADLLSEVRSVRQPVAARPHKGGGMLLAISRPEPGE